MPQRPKSRLEWLVVLNVSDRNCSRCQGKTRGCRNGTASGAQRNKAAVPLRRFDIPIRRESHTVDRK